MTEEELTRLEALKDSYPPSNAFQAQHALPALIAEVRRLRALSDAVEAIERAVIKTWDPDAAGSIVLDEQFIENNNLGMVVYGPLRAALITLAETMKEKEAR